eukprot:CAMPEP_0114978038 /NCGR_PEP_ID=MMETSP0216-20121206/3578_1 /TAXON_ID=223996 /ORGANISM="Protocruzia adherens, Strain Boccale" /LENGTH=494 /DNA_ID=CAMNT_0002339177 /DNA_START=132 /DNA_END=1616 /DNA_ORIENTATION=+
MTDSRREKLLRIQKREELKGMLINKFKNKYNVSNEILDREVNAVLKEQKLTKENLDNLERRLKQADPDARSVASVSMKSRSSKAPSVISGKSVATSRMSGATDLSKKVSQSSRKSAVPDDQKSVASSIRSSATVSSRKSQSVYNADEDDEWAAIQKFNQYLHGEEERQAKQKVRDQKLRMRAELDRQIAEKRALLEEEKRQEKLYDVAQTKHVKVMEERENRKKKEQQDKLLKEKHMRDKQLREENRRKRKEEREQRQLEEMTVRKLHEELDAEKRAAEDKRKNDVEGFKRVRAENEEKRRLADEIKEQERQADVKAQKAYSAMLEKQEADRASEFKRKERRAQELMGKMADTVIKMQDEKAMEHERNMIKAQEEKEYRDRLEDEARKLRLKTIQKETADFLMMQVREKKERQLQDKRMKEEQAQIWKKDLEDYEKAESKRKEKERDINQSLNQVLKDQMAEKHGKGKKMDKTELLLNKQVLKEINSKKQSHEL